MFQDLFALWCTGRLGARRFALLWAVLIFALVVSIILLTATAMATIGQFKADASMKEHAWMGVALVTGVLLMIAALFTSPSSAAVISASRASSPASYS